MPKGQNRVKALSGPAQPKLERLEVARDLPVGDRQPLGLALLALHLDVMGDEVLAQPVAREAAVGQLLGGLAEAGGQRGGGAGSERVDVGLG